MSTTESVTSDSPSVEMDIHSEEAPRMSESKSSQPCSTVPLAARIEALLVSVDRPLSSPKLTEVLGLTDSDARKEIESAIEELNETYETTGRAFRIEKLAGGWQVLTRAEFGPLLAQLHQDRMSTRLSQAAMETLSIVAYRQPLIRAEIEAIRGVSCGEVLRGLLERRLVKIVGRAEELGRPMLYGTTKEFLKVFGLASLDDLPEVEGLERGRPKKSAKTESKTEATGESERADQPVESQEVDEAAK